PQVQADLKTGIEDMYEELPTLEESILTQGWTPVDAILVWELPKKSGKYVVLEGNTRVTVLRRIREDFKALDEEYTKKLKRPDVNKEAFAELKEKRSLYARAISATERLNVRPIRAKSEAELNEALPRILGVRHISHAREWKPYATNMYLTRL